MHFEQPHISDEQLLLSLDGELPAKQRAAIHRHLETCWECRTHLLEMQNSIAGFVHLYHQQFDRQLPLADASRALLRAQLRQTHAGPRRSTIGRWPTTLASVLVTVLVTVAIYAAFRHQSSAAESALPRASLTPGETVAMAQNDVCVTNFPTERSIALPPQLKRSVFERYGMRNARPEDFEVDYLITPDLGGATSVRNLWPEPSYHTTWNSYVKDQLEAHLRSLVCSGQIDLATAQHEISADWIAAYKKYFRTSAPIVTSSF